MKLDNKVYLSLDSKFDWPSTSNNYYKEEGTCTDVPKLTLQEKYKIIKDRRGQL